ncbi:DUF6888 family protein [Phormidesmis priestleyi]
MPTVEQCVSCTQVCQDLTRFYVPIALVRFDRRTKNLFVLGGEAIEIEIRPDGKVRILP